jgi:hypothetical protein
VAVVFLLGDRDAVELLVVAVGDGAALEEVFV